MKKYILLSAIFALTFLFAFAGGGEIPAAVKTKFASLYPTVKKAKWGQEGANYEAEFELNEVETSVLFDVSANVLETESEIKASELPKPVTDYCAKTWAGKKIKEASKIIDSKGTVTYEAEVDGMDHIFDSNGSFIKSVKE
jgi:hypothetical protein